MRRQTGVCLASAGGASSERDLTRHRRLVRQTLSRLVGRSVARSLRTWSRRALRIRVAEAGFVRRPWPRPASARSCGSTTGSIRRSAQLRKLASSVLMGSMPRSLCFPICCQSIKPSGSLLFAALGFSDFTSPWQLSQIGRGVGVWFRYFLTPYLASNKNKHVDRGKG